MALVFKCCILKTALKNLLLSVVQGKLPAEAIIYLSSESLNLSKYLEIRVGACHGRERSA